MAEGFSDTYIMARVLTSSLQCSICLEVFQSPRSLACLHTFCEECLQSLIDVELQGILMFRNMQVTCPSCRNITDLSAYENIPTHQLAKQLPLNFTIKSIIEDIKTAKDRKSIKERQKVQARVIEHNKEVKQCKKHQSKKLRWYCQIHNKVLCKKCVKSEHKRCSVSKLKEIIQEEEINSKSRGIIEGVKNTATELTQSISVLARNKEDLEAEIDSYPATIQALEVQLKKLIGKVQHNIAANSEEAKKKSIVRHEEILSDCTNLLAALEMIDEEYNELRNKGTDIQRFITMVNMENELHMIKTVSESINCALSTVQVQQEMVEVLKSVIHMGEEMLSKIHIKAAPYK